MDKAYKKTVEHVTKKYSQIMRGEMYREIINDLGGIDPGLLPPSPKEIANRIIEKKGISYGIRT